jgi:hypothetical protein
MSENQSAEGHCDPYTDVAHCPHCQEPTWLERQQQRPPTFHSDRLGAVTIPEDNRPTWDSRCEHGSADRYACSTCYYTGADH